ncbi:MAG: hypothetical protein K6F60_00605 [Eubacterium sp.]|nr:hypothetical protein [Eubacterium sp.]
MRRIKKFKGILAIILSIVLIGGFIPGIGATEVEAAEESITISAKNINAGTKSGDGWFIDNNILILSNNYDFILNMDEDLSLNAIENHNSCNLTISGSKLLSLSGGAGAPSIWLSGGTLMIDGANIDSKGPYGIHNESGSISINNSTINIVSDTGVGIIASGSLKIIKSNITTKLNGVRNSNICCDTGELTLSECEIIKPEGAKISETTLDVSSRRQIVDADGNIPKEIVIKSTEKKEETAPEEATEDITPTKEDNSSKKSYKNEWVNGQWYDADGKTSYKYKGSWKKNSIGWWYEDENGWFPTARWQKIDGDWYYFDDIGYMASNEYAGNWTAYSEGYWWVGEDGAWDGSEPGVWRLSGTKWWFKDSTGWYAKGKWYKIGGTWYEFDADGWWIEK